MSKELTRVDRLTAGDLDEHPVWQYVNDDRHGETMVRPVKRTPVATLTGKLVGTQVRLANGSSVWALLGNVDNRNPRMTEHFVTISLERNGKWFTLSRYHDFDYAKKGPDALARFLGLHLQEVFPISYDLTTYARGHPDALVGKILKEPRERLTRAEIIALAVP
jgi:hypothetical protein